MKEKNFPYQLYPYYRWNSLQEKQPKHNEDCRIVVDGNFSCIMRAIWDESSGLFLSKLKIGQKHKHFFNVTHWSDVDYYEIDAYPLPFDADAKVLQDRDEDGQIGEPYSYNDFIKQIENIAGVTDFK